MSQITIKTSQEGWLSLLAKAYKNQNPILVIDDANVGIDLSTDTIFDMGKKPDLSTAEITAVCVSCGMGVSGIALIILAFFDPEPTTKLALVIASGAVLAFTGGWSAIHILTKKKPPNIKIGKDGFEVCWA